ncbi:SUMF1/EgtB/PvdO family nonheme iron enzyme [Ferruginibacter sp.]
MNKQRTINCLFFFLLLISSLPALSQGLFNLRSIEKTISKTNKALAEEFAAIKFVAGKTIMLQEYEGYDSLSFYFPEKISVDSFYISQFEVTNKQYRDFIDYVQDSIVRHLSGYEKQTAEGDVYIDWSKKVDIKQADFPPDRIDHTIPGKPRLLPKYLVYSYKDENKKAKQVAVMPDVDAWIKDYPYTYNEPVLVDRFIHPAFNNYPVTGINYYQAVAYCNWKTLQIQKAMGNDTDIEVVVALPTLYQWEAAATTGYVPVNDTALDNRRIIGINGHRRFLNKPVKANRKNGIDYDCNFSTIVDVNGYQLKNTGDDGEDFTMPVNAYSPNDNGLYNMRGNVAEWTATNGDVSYTALKAKAAAWQQFTDSLKKSNPAALILKETVESFLNKMQGTKIVKGGSWKSSVFYIQPGVNQFYDPATQDGGIGFRYIVLFKRQTK